MLIWATIHLRVDLHIIHFHNTKIFVVRIFGVYINMGIISYKTRLIFDKGDKDRAMEMLKAAVYTWNECSKVKFTIETNSIVDLHAAFYSDFRKLHPEIPAQMVIIAQRSVLSSYRSIKSKKHKIKKPPVKARLSIQLDQRVFSHKNGVFSIFSLGERIKCKPELYTKLQDLIGKYKFGDPLLFVRDDEVWVRLTFKTPDLIIPQTLSLGVDLGCRINAATSEGNLYVDKVFNAEKRRLRYLKDCLKSKGTKSSKRHLKKLKHKESNKNRNFSHNLSKKIIQDTRANVIVLENLKSIKVKKEKDKYKNQNKLSQVPLCQLKEFLTYKALLMEKTVIEVCPSYTSQIDSQTGEKDGERRGRRYYSTYGKIYDSDINAAINIGLRSKLPVSQNSNGGILTYGQATVKTPIVGPVKRKFYSNNILTRIIP